MKYTRYYSLIIVILLFCFSLFSCSGIQKKDAAAEYGLEGTSWIGALTVGAVELRLRFSFIADEEGVLTGTMDSIDQGVNGIPVSNIEINKDGLMLEVSSVGGTFKGKAE